jgi:RHS repeat-associated protein
LYYFNANHLGSGSLITDGNGQTYQTLAYAPYGESLVNIRHFPNESYDERYQFTGYEKDEETGLSQAKNRYYDSKLSIFYSVDALAEKFPNIAGYVYGANNPIMFIDPDGNEPIPTYVGTAVDFRNLLNNSPRGVGAYTGGQAASYLRSLGSTEWSWKQMRPLPTQIGYFNMKVGRYIYTEKGGWLDMSHFMFYAGKAYDYKLQKQSAQAMVNSSGFGFMSPEAQAYWLKQAGMNPAGESLQDGYRQELSDKFAAPYSAYSYEDLPSDRFGADFGANYFDPNSKLSFGEQLYNYLVDKLGATNPQNAPNYNQLPAIEPTDKPTRTNKTHTPVYTKENP